MVTTAPARPDFHETVKRELRRRDWGHRTLAKKLAGEGATKKQIEQQRRSVRRWLIDGSLPHRANRRRVAVVLGLPERLFDLDDEEDSLDAFLMRQARKTARAALRWERRHARQVEEVQA